MYYNYVEYSKNINILMIFNYDLELTITLFLLFSSHGSYSVKCKKCLGRITLINIKYASHRLYCTVRNNINILGNN